MRRNEVKYFGNLLNEQVHEESIKDFLKRAVPQEKYKADNFQVYLLDDEVAVARLSSKNSKVIRYTILGNRYSYKQMYTNSHESEDIFRQALYHGACILTRRNGKSIGLGYDL